jgi:hypothetical protein
MRGEAGQCAKRVVAPPMEGALSPNDSMLRYKMKKLGIAREE